MKVCCRAITSHMQHKLQILKGKCNCVEVLKLLLPSAETTHSAVTQRHLFQRDLQRTDMELLPNIYTYNSYKISRVPEGLSIISHVNNHHQQNP